MLAVTTSVAAVDDARTPSESPPGMSELVATWVAAMEITDRTTAMVARATSAVARFRYMFGPKDSECAAWAQR
jgi:hypothetical protein